MTGGDGGEQAVHPGTASPRVPVEVSPANLAAIAARGVATPEYDRSALQCRLVHIGVGGFHRAHLAVFTHELATQGGDWGIRGIGLLAGDTAMADALLPQGGLYTLIEREDERSSIAVIGSIVDFVPAAARPADAIEHLARPSVGVVSLTITEAGYAVDAGGPGTTFDLLAAALERRHRDGSPPVTIMSCDNVPGNGDAARAATVAAAGRTSPALVSWIEGHCTFPNSMVDRITPKTTDADRDWLANEHHLVDRWPVVTEPFRQWVVEDHFANGRPRWEDVGVEFTDDVEAWELYKLRMLNASHSCMAYLCALAGVVHVDEAIRLPAVRHFLEDLLAEETIPSLEPIAGHPPDEYAATVLHRFANTGVRDQIARLCIDGSSKFPTFLVPTIEYQLAHGGPVTHSALALAGWARYLGTVRESEQAADDSARPARDLAARAVSDPRRFLELDGVMTDPLRNSSRFRDAFVDAYRSVAELGPLAAMDALADGTRRTRSHGVEPV